MGVRVQTLVAGDGKNYPAKGDKLTMHYVGTLKSNGAKFDSSVDRNEPFEFNIGRGQVIQGWEEGVMKMSLGEKAVLHIPYDYAYGEDGIPGAIPPKADLVFEVELLAIGNKKFIKQLTPEEEKALLDCFSPEDFLVGGAKKQAQTSKWKSKSKNKKK